MLQETEYRPIQRNQAFDTKFSGKIETFCLLIFDPLRIFNDCGFRVQHVRHPVLKRHRQISFRIQFGFEHTRGQSFQTIPFVFTQAIISDLCQF